MLEPDEIEFRERVTASSTKPDGRSLPIRIGIVAGAAVLVVVGAVAGMGASPSAPSTPSETNLTAAAPGAGTLEAVELDHGLRGGFGRGGFHAITIRAIDGSILSLETEDGWTRTITVDSDTTITKGGETVAVGDLAVGDRIGFAQEREDDGTFTITAIKVVLPTIGGEVTAVTGDTITVTGRDGATGTIHVDSDTTYEVDGTADQALSDIEVGDVVIAEGALRDDGSLDADVVHSGLHRGRGGFGPGRGPWNKDADPNATPSPTPSTSS
jgi:Domain of unknown function (DUF5666)